MEHNLCAILVSDLIGFFKDVQRFFANPVPLLRRVAYWLRTICARVFAATISGRLAIFSVQKVLK